MSTLTQAHPVFKKGAVLRHSDLNDQMEYIKNLIGCSNALLAGIGIVRGLDISCSGPDNGYTINIGPGLAVMNLGSQTSLNNIDALGGQLVELLKELHFVRKKSTPFTAADAFTSIEELTNDTDGAPLAATDMARCIFVLADITETNNSSASCFRDSETNEKKSLKLRFFLGTPALKEAVDPQCFALPCIPCFNGADLEKIVSVEGLNKLLEEKTRTGARELDSAIASLVNCYPGLFCEAPLKTETIASAETTPLLYAYNYLQTLYAAFTELIALPYFINDPYVYKTYPGTLALGNCEGSCAEGKFCRHHWHDATANAAFAPEATFYAKRLTALTQPGNLNFTAPSQTHLTPSRSDAAPLSERAIPFYVKAAALRPLWNYQATFLNTTAAIPPNQLGPCYMEGCNWVRSEGYIGKNIVELQSIFNNDNQLTSSELHTAQAEANLPFQIKICSINAGGVFKRTKFESFDEYRRRNPGLKPCAGVPKGGTLVLLVDAPGPGAPADIAPPLVFADFCLPYYDAFVAARVQNLFAEFIVEAPNHFTIDNQGTYVFEVPRATKSLNIFFKSVSENADILKWAVHNITNPATIIVPGQGSAFQHNFEVNEDVIYEVRLTAGSSVQTGSDSIAKQIRFVFTVPQDLDVMAQFVVESPNNFEETEIGKQETYTFPIERLVKNEPVLRAFFKSTSENATAFEWLVDGKPVTNNDGSAFNHQFFFSRARSTFEVSLRAIGSTHEDRIKKLVRGVHADFAPGQHRLPPGSSELQAPDEMYKGVLSEKYTIQLGGIKIEDPALIWTNQSVRAEIYRWKVWDISKANAPQLLAEVKTEQQDQFEFQLPDNLLKNTSFVIELNATNNNSTVSSQKNILVDIEVGQFAVRPSEKDVVATSLSTRSNTNIIGQLRIRHKAYRDVLTALGKAHALFAKTAGYKNALAFLDSGDDPEQLQKTFGSLAQQLIRNIKLEGGTPNEVYQTALQQLIYFSFDKFTFLHSGGLPAESAAAMQHLFQQMKAENTFPDLAVLKKDWHSEAIRSEDNRVVIQSLEALFDS